MLQPQKVRDIPANNKLDIEITYYKAMGILERLEHKLQQMMSIYKAEHQKVIELQEKLKKQQEEDELDRFSVEVID